MAMIEVYGVIKVNNKKRTIHLSTEDNETAANVAAVAFLRERHKKGLWAEAKAVDEEQNIVLHLALEDPKPTLVTKDELDIIEKGGKFI